MFQQTVIRPCIIQCQRQQLPKSLLQNMLHLLIAIYYSAENHTSIYRRHTITYYMPMQSTHITVSFADISVIHRIKTSVCTYTLHVEKPHMQVSCYLQCEWWNNENVYFIFYNYNYCNISSSLMVAVTEVFPVIP